MVGGMTKKLKKRSSEAEDTKRNVGELSLSACEARVGYMEFALSCLNYAVTFLVE